MKDGARDALAGYLYQILAAAGVAARARGGFDDTDELTCDLVLLARQSQILHEVHGEDVVLQHAGPANEATAVQCKFSRSASSAPIQPSDLREILHAFDRTRQAAAPDLNVTGFILLTNRLPSPTVSSLYNKRERQPIFRKLQEPERRWLIIPNRKAGAIKEQYGSTRAAAEAWHTVFRKLRFFCGVPSQHWLEGLQRYAIERGLPPERFEGCLSTLVGEAVRGTIQHQLELSRAWLNRTLLGFPDARSLVLRADGDSAREAARIATEQWYSETLVTRERTVIRRPLYAAVEQQVAQFPVVLLLGDGGCGKSVLAGRYACDAGSRHFIGSVATRAFHQYWLGETFNRWRSAKHAHDLDVSPLNEVLRRVRLANEREKRPLLVVNVDGLDEATDEERLQLRTILDVCRKQEETRPHAFVLLLTARLSDRSPEQTRDRLIRELASVHYPAEIAEQFGLVSVRDFDDDELRLAIAGLPSPVRNRLEEAIHILSGRSSATATLGEEAELAATQPVFDSSLVGSLHHPALWGEFLDLDHNLKEGVLDGQQDAVNEFAGRFIERFLFKLQRRRPTWPTQAVRESLRAIAAAFPNEGQRGNRSQHWILPAIGPLREVEARDLFQEAISYGMITEDEHNWWRWRHGFVMYYLRALEDS